MADLKSRKSKYRPSAKSPKLEVKDKEQQSPKVPKPASESKLPSKKQSSYVPEFENIIRIRKPEEHLTMYRLTLAEYTDIISIRSKDIENGAQPYVPMCSTINETAKSEVLQKQCPLSIRRCHNDGTAEDIPVNSMELPAGVM